MTREGVINALAGMPENVAIGCVVEAGRLRERKRLATRADVVAVVRACAQAYGVTEEQIRGRSRPRQVVRARFRAYFLLLDLFSLSAVKVGIALDRDHTSVLNGAPQGAADDSKEAHDARVLAAAAMMGMGG